ncbi:GPI inositol-deacylase-like [Lytechinus pictus]|uniref:GPI inositol-deacylase-like n=1 Tax=Lytechinus pictus TaxID=7653 RepID=UPI0030BA0AB2
MRFHGALLPSFVVDVALLTVSFILSNLATKKPVESFITTQSTHCKPFIVVPFVSLLRKIIPHVYTPLAEADNFKVLDDQGINFAALPILFFIFGYVILTILTELMELDVLFFGKLLSLFKGTSMNVDSTPYTGSLGYSLFLYAILGGLMAVCVGSCGAVVLLLLVLLYLLKVIALQARVNVLKGCLNLPKDANVKDEDGKEKESGTKSQEDKSAASTTDTSTPSPLDVAQTTLYFHFAVMILTLLLALLNLPSLAFWVKNMKHEIYNLERDPALYPTLVVIAALTVLLDPAYTIPKNGLFTRAFSWVVYAFTLITLLYASDAMYRLSYLLASTIFLIAINQAML